MTEDVLVSVRGLHTLNTAQDEEIEVFSAGKYYFRNGKHYLLYDEQVEENGDVVSNRITLKDGGLEIVKKGAMNAKMTFLREERTECWYETPFGEMLVGLEVTDMKTVEEEDLLEIHIAYRLELNYEHVADCRIRIRAVAKGSPRFHLR